MQHTSNTKTDGFTLVETLVAISILMLVIIGPMTVVQKSMHNAYFANEQVTATFLAQQGIEAVRQLRDDEALEGWDDTGSGFDTSGWLQTLNTCEAASGGCGLSGSGRDKVLQSCAGIAACKVYLNEDTGEYVDNSGVHADTPFTRKITVDSFAGGDLVLVTTEVTWMNANISAGQRSVKLQTYLYDHYKRFEND